MFTRTIHFQPVTLRQSVSYKCIDCKKPRTRMVKVEHTVNPFNKNEDGTVKTREQVRERVREVHAKEVAETKAGIRCNKCKDAVVAAREAERKAQRTRESDTK